MSKQIGMGIVTSAWGRDRTKMRREAVGALNFATFSLKYLFHCPWKAPHGEWLRLIFESVQTYMSMKFDAGMPRHTLFRADNSFEHTIDVNSLSFTNSFETTIKSKSFYIWLCFFSRKKMVRTHARVVRLTVVVSCLGHSRNKHFSKCFCCRNRCKK